jgi:hypothetical protein
MLSNWWPLLTAVIVWLVFNSSIDYEIGATHLSIRCFSFELMHIPYSEVKDIAIGWAFMQRFRMIALGNRFGKGCMVEKTRGWFRYVLITPNEPEALLAAFHAFHGQSGADPNGQVVR